MITFKLSKKDELLIRKYESLFDTFQNKEFFVVVNFNEYITLILLEKLVFGE